MFTARLELLGKIKVTYPYICFSLLLYIALGEAPNGKEMELSRGGDLFEHVCLRFRGRLVVGI